MRLFIGLSGPVLGAFIDRTDKRKTWMKGFYVALICSTSFMAVLFADYVWLVGFVAFGMTGVFDRWTENIVQTYLPYISLVRVRTCCRCALDVDCDVLWNHGEISTSLNLHVRDCLFCGDHGLCGCNHPRGFVFGDVHTVWSCGCYAQLDRGS